MKGEGSYKHVYTLLLFLFTHEYIYTPTGKREDL